MDAELNRKILLALLQRLTADAKLPEPHYTSVVSNLERQALNELLGEPANQLITSMPPVVATSDDPVSPAPDPNYSLNLACVTARPKPTHIVCIDFGTAKSKAFAARVDAEEGETDDIDGSELGLGKLDGDLDRAVYTVSSSVWISDDGRMFAGSDALRHSAEAHDRERLDSIKQQLIQTNHQLTLNRPLPNAINPTSVRLTYADAMCFYLAYLTDLIGRALEEVKLSRYAPRRFTIPAWPESQRKWANKELRVLLKRAQILADTFTSRWAAGIPAAEVKWAIEAASEHDGNLDHILDSSMSRFEFGISEPMAAGSGRIRIDRSTRNLVLIVDVGAGTTDLGLFLVNHERRTASPVGPGSAAIRMAGDYIDNVLVDHILTKAGGYLDSQTKDLISRDLRRAGLRQYKEMLFNAGSVSLTLVTGMPVKIDRDEFLQTASVRTFADLIENQLRDFLSKIDMSFAPVAEQPTLLLTGGGADIPFIKDLATKRWTIAGKDVSFRAAKRVPDAVSIYDADFQREYPQLAVAMGGATKAIDERQALAEFLGTSIRPGVLTRYAVTGPN